VFEPAIRTAVRAPLALALLLAMPLVAAQAPPPSAFPGEAPEGPQAAILYFEAGTETIERGESVALQWEALNTFSVALEPGIGPVPTRGVQRVAPSVTTTYTLTVTGTGGTRAREVTVVVEGTDSNAAVATTSTPPATRAMPRLTGGKPDLSGVYMAGRDIGLVGEVTLVPGAERFAPDANPDDLGQGVSCLPPGVPGATLMPFPLQIVHKPDMLVIVYEAYSLVRIIRIDGEHPIDLYPTWMGHSVAHWDGDTLVVDATGFNDRTRIAGHGHTEDMRVTERYTRTGYDTIAYEAVVEDPNVFAAPVRYAGDFTLHPEWEIGEYFCMENPKDYDALFETP
jgi:hypothetical protein